jgi:hypothetical protein
MLQAVLYKERFVCVGVSPLYGGETPIFSSRFFHENQFSDDPEGAKPLQLV